MADDRNQWYLHLMVYGSAINILSLMNAYVFRLFVCVCFFMRDAYFVAIERTKKEQIIFTKVDSNLPKKKRYDACL